VHVQRVANPKLAAPACQASRIKSLIKRWAACSSACAGSSPPIGSGSTVFTPGQLRAVALRSAIVRPSASATITSTARLTSRCAGGCKYHLRLSEVSEPCFYRDAVQCEKVGRGGVVSRREPPKAPARGIERPLADRKRAGRAGETGSEGRPAKPHMTNHPSDDVDSASLHICFPLHHLTSMHQCAFTAIRSSWPPEICQHRRLSWP
jgi:hypothetical protein